VGKESMKAPSPQDSSAGDISLSEIERASAEWMLRRALGLTIEEDDELARWLAADKERARIFAEMEQSSHHLDDLNLRTADAPAAVQPRKLSWCTLVGVAAVLLAAGGWAFTHGLASSDYAMAESTKLGEVRRLEFPDGSVALLNTSTAVEISYNHDARRVRILRGEALFTVVENAERPFVVQAGRMAVCALGTAFDVRLSSDALSVLVTEGDVRVSGDAAGLSTVGSDTLNAGRRLEAGHMARVVLDAGRAPKTDDLMVFAMTEGAIRSSLAWQKGRLEFSDTPLADVIAEFNRYNRHKIVIADAALAVRRFGGGFDFHQIEPLLELLEQSFGVVAEQRANETVIRLVK